MFIDENIPLAPLTTFGIGGPARFFARVTTVGELQEALVLAKGKDLPVFILGGGSNVLIDDRGFEGLVIKIEIKGIEEGDGLLIAGAGESWDALVELAIEKNLWGIENLSGIPGTVGGAPVQNIGAYGAELQDVFEFVEAFDTTTGSIVRLPRSGCAFGYRTSGFKKTPGRFIIVRVALRLMKEGAPNLSYRDIAEAFEGERFPTLDAIREAVLKIRAKKFPDLHKEGTAGSFFLNPTVSPVIAARLGEAYPELPQFPAEQGIKISLAWLLDRVLHAKGMRVGKARCFEHQPLVLVVEKNSSARDVRELAEKISGLVQKNFGIALEPEVRVI